MINATLRLTRTAADGAEMFRKYFLIADFGHVPRQGRASIVPLSVGAPMPADDHLTVRGDEKVAMLAALDVVMSLAGNEGFTATIDFDPD